MQLDAMTQMREECRSGFAEIAADDVPDSVFTDGGKVLIAHLFRGLGDAAF